ncbi:hypothetical protein [Streptomyces sp. NPDC088135]
MNRIKKIKRQLHGRAGFELLRKMVLLQQPTTTTAPELRQNHYCSMKP